jgi:hypothetical protein
MHNEEIAQGKEVSPVFLPILTEEGFSKPGTMGWVVGWYGTKLHGFTTRLPVLHRIAPF